MLLIGVDTGGTFTDLFALLPSGDIVTHKLLSTPHDPAFAFIDGLDALLEQLRGTSDIDVRRSSRVVHGSTVATNAVLERKGAKTAWVTTKGFKDLLHIARQNRAALYDLAPQAPPPLIDRDLCFEIQERISADGEVVIPLDLNSVSSVANQLKRAHVESVALLFLHSYQSPQHEKEAAASLRQHGLLVYPSHEVFPEYREYERGSTTALNAYVSPVIAKYLSRLEQPLRQRGFDKLSVMQSSGGISDVDGIRDLGVHTILSGPAGGVVGAKIAAQQVGVDHMITFDMGGTSTDVSLVPGDILFTAESTIEGYPLKTPMVDIHTVGAGGGSIAYLDHGGALRVGPQSAGADPGPACYGQGGHHFTVTDANVVLGRIPPRWFLGGRMQLDIDASERACFHLADRLGATIQDTAMAVIHVASAQMERAIKTISAARGHDTRDFTLVAYGGAGPLYACHLAHELSMPQVLVPPDAGLLSAVGVAVADVVKHISQGIVRQLDHDLSEELEAMANRLVAATHEALESEGVEMEHRRIQLYVDLRYERQSYELTLPVTNLAADDLIRQFHRKHEMKYGYARQHENVEITAVKVRGEGQTPKVRATPLPRQTTTPGPVDRSQALFHTAAGSEDTPIYDRKQLGSGATLIGPAIIASSDATVLIPPGDRCHVHPTGALMIHIDPNRQ